MKTFLIFLIFSCFAQEKKSNANLKTSGKVDVKRETSEQTKENFDIANFPSDKYDCKIISIKSKNMDFEKSYSNDSEIASLIIMEVKNMQDNKTLSRNNGIAYYSNINITLTPVSSNSANVEISLTSNQNNSLHVDDEEKIVHIPGRATKTLEFSAIVEFVYAEGLFLLTKGDLILPEITFQEPLDSTGYQPSSGFSLADVLKLSLFKTNLVASEIENFNRNQLSTFSNPIPGMEFFISFKVEQEGDFFVHDTYLQARDKTYFVLNSLEIEHLSNPPVNISGLIPLNEIKISHKRKYIWQSGNISIKDFTSKLDSNNFTLSEPKILSFPDIEEKDRRDLETALNDLSIHALNQFKSVKASIKDPKVRAKSPTNIFEKTERALEDLTEYKSKASWSNSAKYVELPNRKYETPLSIFFELILISENEAELNIKISPKKKVILTNYQEGSNKFKEYFSTEDLNQPNNNQGYSIIMFKTYVKLNQ